MSNRYLSIDIETRPETDAVLNKLMPAFEAGAGLKDPIKIQEAKARKRAKWLEEAALSPLSGRVVAVGLQHYEEGRAVDTRIVGVASEDESGREEKLLVSQACATLDLAQKGINFRVVGFGIQRFDLPFLQRRAWKYGLHFPEVFRGRYLAPWLIDVREAWSNGDPYESGSLDTVAKFFGMPGKLGDGKDFARLYANPATRGQAEAYLIDDLTKAYRLAERMRLLDAPMPAETTPPETPDEPEARPMPPPEDSF